MKRLGAITLLALSPVAAIPQSGAEPFIEYSMAECEIWLDSAYFSHWYRLPDSDIGASWDRLTDDDYAEVAAELDVEVAAIKAVVDIETGSRHLGFWKKGKAIINFDLSIYRTYAPRHNVNLSDARKRQPLIFRSPDVKKYGSTQAAQYARLEAAIEIDRESALESCFWGMFQIGGFNWKLCGCESVDEFCALMNRSERDQLKLFAAFCRARCCLNSCVMLREFLDQYHLLGPAIGLATFLIIGFFHPVVIKTEYHFGTRPWWIFLLVGIAAVASSVIIADVFWSSILGVFGFSSFWTIKELFEQRERVIKGWFPKNPRRSAQYPD